MAEVASLGLLPSEAQVQYQGINVGNCGRQNSNGTGFSPSTSDSPFKYHSTTGGLVQCGITGRSAKGSPTHNTETVDIYNFK